MIGGETGLLGQIISAANNWRTTAQGVGVQLTQVNYVLPDGRPLTIHWSNTENDWVIETHE